MRDDVAVLAAGVRLEIVNEIREIQPKVADARNRVALSTWCVTDIHPEELGKRIRRLRLTQKLSQRELGERVGVTHRTISCIEANTQGRAAVVPLRLLADICAACSFPLSRMLDPTWYAVMR